MSAPAAPAFVVHLPVFSGPLDLLVALISRRELDVTQVALAEVTDEFLAHVRALPDGGDLGQTTEFLVVAATLLDLKVARLLPQPEVVEQEDLALLEARDLLLARLLQHRAFQQAGQLLAALMVQEDHHVGREVGLDPGWARSLPEVELPLDPQGLATLAAAALAPAEEPTVDVDHVHVARVDVLAEERELLRRLHGGPLDFAALVVGESTAVVVGRFLALLALLRERLIEVQQAGALAELRVSLA